MVFTKPLPLDQSQLIDQVMAPRTEQAVDGLKLPQFVPFARQSSALLTTDGAT